jgi:hypothetical protein
MEHRWGERLKVRTRVSVRARGGVRGIGYIQDISVSGALIVSGVPATSMSFVRLILPASSSMGRRSIEGQVVRHTENGFAVEWCELAPQILHALTQRSPLQQHHDERLRQWRVTGAYARRRLT